MWVVIAIAAFAFSGTLFVTKLVSDTATRTGLLDIPNKRSAHTVPTPRGGGLAIVATTSFCVAILAILGFCELRLAFALLCGGAAVSLIGFIDDRTALSALSRLGVHFGSAAAAVLVLGGVPAIPVGDHLIDLGVFGDFLGILAIVWSINLFNFMDGIDGLAGAEAVFVCLAGALLSAGYGASESVAVVALLVGSSCLGFLRWNWSPASIFMGDVGSGYLGYVISVLGLTAMVDNPAAIYAWLILGGVFFADASVTLLVRLRHGEKVYEAHNVHAYQCLARKWKSHKKVSLMATALNVVWLLPLAWLAMAEKQASVWIVVLAIGPLFVLARFAGAGNRERI